MTNPPLDLRPEVLDAAVELMGQAGRHADLPVEGESMSPSIPDGSRIHVLLRPPTPPRMGDVLVFRQADSLVVHRYLSRVRRDGRKWLRTRGDGKILFDPFVEPERVLGKVLSFTHEGKRWELDGRLARAYALKIALHDLFWGFLGRLARGVDIWLEPEDGPRRCTGWAHAADAFLLSLAHRMVFPLFHRRSH